MLDLYLASASPRRAELLTQIGVPFCCLPVDIDETPHAGEQADAYVERLAREKATAAWQTLPAQSGACVLGADTSVVLDGRILGKPRDRADALATLAALGMHGRAFRGQTVMSGVLGLRMQEKQGSGDADKFINLLIEVRSEVRKQKLWPLSDLIRDRLKELGVTLEDSKEGSTWRWG